MAQKLTECRDISRSVDSSKESVLDDDKSIRPLDFRHTSLNSTVRQYPKVNRIAGLVEASNGRSRSKLRHPEGGSRLNKTHQINAGSPLDDPRESAAATIIADGNGSGNGNAMESVAVSSANRAESRPFDGVASQSIISRSLGPSVRRLGRKAALSASGQIGAGIASVLVLSFILALSSLRFPLALEMAAALVITRVAYFHTRGPKPVLLLYQVRKRVNRLLVDETAVAIAMAALCFVMGWSVSPITLGVFYVSNLAVQLCLMSASRLLIKRLADSDRLSGRAHVASKQAIIVGTGSHACRIADMIQDSPELETRLLGFLDYRRKGLWRHHDVPLIGDPDALADIVANTQVDALFWAVDPLDIPRAWGVLKTAEKMGVAVFVMPSVYEPKFARIRPTYVNGMPAMVYRSDPEDQVALLMKNLTDRLGALLALLVFSPLMILTALAVKLSNPGPVLFRQKRTGLNGKQFTLFKFRTMVTDAEDRKHQLLEQNEMTGPVFKMTGDPRVTPIGKFLRKFSIDELPQLFNVLRGEMSLVGPRPPLPSEVSRFEPWQHRKLAVKPGLTCLWQVHGRNNIDFEEWMRLDLEYIDNWSLWLDTRILLKTVPAVLSGSGR